VFHETQTLTQASRTSRRGTGTSVGGIRNKDHLPEVHDQLVRTSRLALRTHQPRCSATAKSDSTSHQQHVLFAKQSRRHTSFNTNHDFVVHSLFKVTQRCMRTNSCSVEASGSLRRAGHTRWDVSSTFAPLSTRYLRVGIAARIRVSSEMLRSASMGTLRSARTSTRLPCTYPGLRTCSLRNRPSMKQ
jgi:hypothetical protein